MPWELDYIEDGVAPGAAGINELFEDAEAVINDLDTPNIRRGTFNQFNGADVVVGKTLAAGYQVVASHGLHEYSEDIFGADLDYDTASDFVESPANCWTVIGDGSAGGAYVGAGGPEFVIAFDDDFRLDGSYSTGDVHRVGAVEIGLNIEVHDFALGGGSALATGGVLFAIQFRTVESATWRTLLRSIRVYSLDDRHLSTGSITEDMDFDAAIRELLTVDDLPNSTNRVHSVRAVVSLHAVGGIVSGDIVRLREGNFSAIPVRCLAVSQ